jgi:hypothetical protein
VGGCRHPIVSEPRDLAASEGTVIGSSALVKKKSSQGTKTGGLEMSLDRGE